MKFSYSIDGECYYGDYDTIEEAVAESMCCDDLSVGDVALIAEVFTPSAKSYINIDNILEGISDSVYDHLSDGDIAESWPSKLSPAHAEELKTLIANYIDTHAPAPFTLPANVMEVVITEAMVEANK